MEARADDTAKAPTKTLASGDITGDQGVTDPEPRPVRAQQEKKPYHQNAAPVGKVSFDAPQGSMVCSATVVKDPKNPGMSNLVWTAGHCLHAGQATREHQGTGTAEGPLLSTSSSRGAGLPSCLE